MTQIHYATANGKRPAPGGVGDLKTPADFDRASEIALNARDSELFNRIRAVRAKMFGGAAGGRSAAGDLAKPKRFASPLAREFAALSAQCRRISSRADQARIAAALREGDAGKPRDTSNVWCPDPDDPDDVIYLED